MIDEDNVHAGVEHVTDGAFYKSIIEQARDIILVVNTDGWIINANQAAINAYGYSLEELRGLRVHDLRSPETRAVVDDQIKIAQRTGSLFRTMHLRRTGEPFPVEVNSQIVYSLNGEVIVSIVRDITETVAMEETLQAGKDKFQCLSENLTAVNEELTASEEELRQQFDELLTKEEKISRQNIVLHSLHKTALGLMQRLDLNDVLSTIISSATSLVDTPHGYISLVNEEKGIFERKIGLGYYAQDVGRQIRVTEGIVGRVFKTGEMCVINDYSTWEERLDGSFFDQLHGIAQVPLKAGNKVFGTFGLAFLTPDRKFTDDEIVMLHRFAELASIALINAHLHSSLTDSEKQLQENIKDLMATHEELLASEEELRQQFDELLIKEEKISRQNIVLNSLHEMTLGLMHGLDLDEVLRTIIASATQLLGTPDGFINLVDESEGIFIRKVAVGKFIQDMTRRTKVTEGLLGKAYTSGQIVFVNDYGTWEHRFSAPIFDGYHCTVVVPLKKGDRVIGAFGLGFAEPERTLTDYEISLLRQFADLASIAIDNATLVTSYKTELMDRMRAQASNQALINAIPDLMFIINDEGQFLDFKTNREQLYISSSRFLGKTVFEVLPPEIAAKAIHSIQITLATGGIQIFEYQMPVHDKTEHFEARIVVSGENEVLAIIRNITERKELEEQLKRLSLNDALTGLYNRAFFEEQMKHQQRLRAEPAGLIVCDIDGLKIVNDTLGHHMGDVVLIAVADILKDVFRQGDLLARIGGDEFAALLPGSSTKEIEADCHRIREKINEYNARKPTVPISLSMGFAVSREMPLDMNALFKEADDNMYREKLHQQKSARSAIVQALIKALEARDFITEGHGDRLQEMIQSFASAIGMPDSSIPDLRLFARFHDIGKVGIPDSILFKPGRLTEEEWIVMRRHCEIGYRIAMSTPDLAPIADWILKHQELWNGKGYPLGLAGKAIPLECRMLALVDAYDAMTSDRPYRKAMGKKEAIAELIRCSGTQFDPSLTQIFITTLN